MHAGRGWSWVGWIVGEAWEVGEEELQEEEEEGNPAERSSRRGGPCGR